VNCVRTGLAMSSAGTARRPYRILQGEEELAVKLTTRGHPPLITPIQAR
jgi:hypothetical protein